MGDVESQLEKCSMAVPDEKPTIYVEIQLKKESGIHRAKIQSSIKQLLQDEEFVISSSLEMMEIAPLIELREHISNVKISYDDEQFAEHPENNNIIDYCDITRKFRYQDVNVQYCIYKLNYEEPASESLDENCDLAAATHWVLPSASLNGLWEMLIYDCHIKSQLLNFATSTVLFSDKNVNSNVVSWNRVILLHGPPGTGKTSLCKALAHKLAIRFNHRYSYGQLIEINSHSLFSKWFSESGKLVMKMFEKIQEYIDDPCALVVVLIDEVESLAHARKSILAGNEPSDAIRVVNAILTQIDAIKKYPNVIILTTSNVTGAIDLALVDRADIKQFIGLPSVRAIYKIYNTCITELMRTGIIYMEEDSKDDKCASLVEISEKSKGLSGRTLRKLPFLAHALFLKKKSSTLSEFLDALSKAVDRQFEEMKDLQHCP